MTVELTFKGDVPASIVDEALLPPGGSVGITTSADSPGINRHEITIIQSGDFTRVRVDGAGKSELSANTEQSIIDAVPSEHIRTRDI